MWRQLFPKVLKWCISAFFMIWGVALLMIVNSGHIWGLMPAIFCFGIVYWQYRTRKEFPKQVALASLLVFAVALCATLYVNVTLFPFNMGMFPALTAWTLILGTPVIAYMYWKYD